MPAAGQLLGAQGARWSISQPTSLLRTRPEQQFCGALAQDAASAASEPATSGSTSFAYSPAEFSELRPWQVERLREQAASGRKNVKVKELCAKLQLNRAQVLHWLKEYEDAPPSPPPPKAQHYAHNSWGPPLQASAPAGHSPTDTRNWQSPARSAGSASAAQPAQQDWSSKGSKRLGGQARHTLDAILSSTRWPSKQIIDEACLVHKASRAEVMAYLAQRRKELRH